MSSVFAIIVGGALVLTALEYSGASLFSRSSKDSGKDDDGAKKPPSLLEKHQRTRSTGSEPRGRRDYSTVPIAAVLQAASVKVPGAGSGSFAASALLVVRRVAK